LGIAVAQVNAELASFVQRIFCDLNKFASYYFFPEVSGSVEKKLKTLNGLHSEMLFIWNKTVRSQIDAQNILVFLAYHIHIGVDGVEVDCDEEATLADN
jgi:hypothetical protein